MVFTIKIPTDSDSISSFNLQYGIIYSQQEEGSSHPAALDVVILHVEAHLAANEPSSLGINRSCKWGICGYDIKVMKVYDRYDKRDLWLGARV